MERRGSRAGVMCSLVVHAHFYQPPRENPDFDEVEAEPSAAPYHDWNQRVERECYRAVVAARVTGSDGRIARVVNTLESVSFNVGPTLFEWMERRATGTYDAIRAADRASCVALDGHGNALAQPYHHLILPLASRRDKTTEVRWGIADFRRRFGREPEGMWLPETAVDDETLDVLAAEGIRFTILAPHQVAEPPPRGLPGLYTTEAGREIALCIYDSGISHGIAFGSLLGDADKWWQAIDGARTAARCALGESGTTPEAASPSLVSAATDGETYGHHHRFSEMALARVLSLARHHGMRVENFASFLAANPAVHPGELVAPSSWSCAHGVERWRSDCGCRMNGARNPSQAWRAPLRRALEQLAEGLHERFEQSASRFFASPWDVRDAYGEVVGGDPASLASTRAAFLDRFMSTGTASGDRERALQLLEMERDALRAFTSCAWFFDDIAGIEPRQVLRYARRAIRLSGAGEALESSLVETLGSARSNDLSVGTGAEVYQGLATAATPEARVAAAATALLALRLGGPAHLPASVGVTVGEDRVDVIDQRTSSATGFRTVLQSRTANDLVCRVDAIDGGESALVPLADFPESARHAVRGALRNALLPACLTTEELGLLASGDASLRGLTAVALTRAVQRIGPENYEEALTLAHAMMDLFDQLEAPTPFDAQTAFFRVWDAADAPARTRLVALGRRLGFAREMLGS